jgi:hypothetical protein
MKSDDALPRLADSADESLLRDGIAAARRDTPDDERMKALSVAFGAKLGALGASGAGGASGGGASGAAGTGGSSAVALKGAGIVASAVVVAGALWYATRTTAPPAEPPNTTPAVVASAPRAESPKAAQPDPIPTLSVAELPKVAPSPVPKPETSAETPKESDMALLGRAQKVLGANPSQALVLLGEHAKLYPRSGFGQEREVMTIDALVRLGRRAEAEARANQFKQAYPKSGHNRRIDSLLGR